MKSVYDLPGSETRKDDFQRRCHIDLPYLPGDIFLSKWRSGEYDFFSKVDLRSQAHVRHTSAIWESDKDRMAFDTQFGPIEFNEASFCAVNGLRIAIDGLKILEETVNARTVLSTHHFLYGGPLDVNRSFAANNVAARDGQPSCALCCARPSGRTQPNILELRGLVARGIVPLVVLPGVGQLAPMDEKLFGREDIYAEFWSDNEFLANWRETNQNQSGPELAIQLKQVLRRTEEYNKMNILGLAAYHRYLPHIENVLTHLLGKDNYRVLVAPGCHYSQMAYMLNNSQVDFIYSNPIPMLLFPGVDNVITRMPDVNQDLRLRSLIHFTTWLNVATAYDLKSKEHAMELVSLQSHHDIRRRLNLLLHVGDHQSIRRQIFLRNVEVPIKEKLHMIFQIKKGGSAKPVERTDPTLAIDEDLKEALLAFYNPLVRDKEGRVSRWNMRGCPETEYHWKKHFHNDAGSRLAGAKVPPLLWELHSRAWIPNEVMSAVQHGVWGTYHRMSKLGTYPSADVLLYQIGSARLRARCIGLLTQIIKTNRDSFDGRIYKLVPKPAEIFWDDSDSGRLVLELIEPVVGLADEHEGVRWRFTEKVFKILRESKRELPKGDLVSYASMTDGPVYAVNDFLNQNGFSDIVSEKKRLLIFEDLEKDKFGFLCLTYLLYIENCGFISHKGFTNIGRLLRHGDEIIELGIALDLLSKGLLHGGAPHWWRASLNSMVTEKEQINWDYSWCKPMRIANSLSDNVEEILFISRVCSMKLFRSFGYVKEEFPAYYDLAVFSELINAARDNHRCLVSCCASHLLARQPELITKTSPGMLFYTGFARKLSVVNNNNLGVYIRSFLTEESGMSRLIWRRIHPDAGAALKTAVSWWTTFAHMIEDIFADEPDHETLNLTRSSTIFFRARLIARLEDPEHYYRKVPQQHKERIPGSAAGDCKIFADNLLLSLLQHFETLLGPTEEQKD